MTMPITDHYLIKYLCNQCDESELKAVLREIKHWVIQD